MRQEEKTDMRGERNGRIKGMSNRFNRWDKGQGRISDRVLVSDIGNSE